MAVNVSSSYFLHLPKVDLHVFSSATNVLDVSEILQPEDLMAVSCVTNSLFDQQSQASLPDELRQPPTKALKEDTEALHKVTAVMFGRVKVAGLQELLMLASQARRSSVRLVSCLAPEEFVLP